jgi:CubicO group peptidase (beta-lactamase class C family)
LLASIVLALLVALGLGAVRAQPASAAERFAGELDQLRTILRIPALSAVVLHRQEVIWADGFGLADVEGGVAATVDTPYQLASLTKPVAATLVMMLDEKGALALDDSVDRYGVRLPEGPAVTVRQLLSHTSAGVPGREHRYDGQRYALLGEVIAGATGEAFGDALAGRVLEPLGMTRTAPNDPTCGAGDVAGLTRDPRYEAVYAGLARPYLLTRDAEVAPGAYPDAFNPAAGLISTVADLARFDAALDRGLLVAGDARERMFAPAISTTGAALPYGLGWAVFDGAGTRLVWHAGQWTPSASALYLKAPDLELTFIALANSDALSAPYPLSRPDPLTSTAALLFYEAFVMPELHGATVPDVDWEADADTLVDALGAVAEPELRALLERELRSYRLAYASVGRGELVARLSDVHARAFSDLGPSPAETHRPPERIAAPPLGSGEALTPAQAALLAGRYRLAPSAAGAPLPPFLTIAPVRGGLAMVDPRPSCTVLVPITAEAFHAPTVPGSLVAFPDGQDALVLLNGPIRVPYLRDEAPSSPP